MASKILTLSLGGKERSLCFGKFGFTENIREITSQDPIEYLSQTRSTPKEQFDFVEAITYAGLISQCDFDGVVPDFTREDVHRWVKGLEFSEAVTIINDCVGSFMNLVDKSQGEGMAQTNVAVMTN